jgi:CO/xanthine dehydrogenase Mo-binding subunit
MAVEQSNFYDYLVPRMNEVPAMHIEVIQIMVVPIGTTIRLPVAPRGRSSTSW